MGIDIYMRWKGMTKADEEAQYTGFSVNHGHVGYLREAYHGAPYATKVLCAESFASDTCEAQIPAKVLKARLPGVKQVVLERERVIYKSTGKEAAGVVKSYEGFVKLAALKEKETGEPVTIVASY
jgi:hypothetical protein